MIDSSSSMQEPGCPFTLVFEYGSSNQLKYAAIFGKDRKMVDACSCTNGVLYPVPSSTLSKAVEVGSDILKLISNPHEISKEQLRGELERAIEKLNRNEEPSQPKREGEVNPEP